MGNYELLVPETEFLPGEGLYLGGHEGLGSGLLDLWDAGRGLFEEHLGEVGVVGLGLLFGKV